MTQNTRTITPDKVHETLGSHMLADGFDIVLDLEKSRGARIHDSRSGKDFLDFFTCFASSPIGFNHPKLTTQEFIEKLGRVSVNKPSNSDLYTIEMAEFVDAFARLAAPKALPHLFFVSGGALAVENALKVAFDWKVRLNIARGVNRPDEYEENYKGSKVIHFQQCFHGRSGYTLSLTNTFDPKKTQYFPKFDWPRVLNPKMRFPLEGKNLEDTASDEREALAQIYSAIEEYGADIAAMIIEPIQGEGGDNHFRPEFMKALRDICDEHDILLVFDEIQTGMGLTGTMWAFEQLGATPDIVCFGKKSQVCGIMVSDRVNEVPDNVFKVSSRINSTWGGNLTDMVRCQKYLEVMHEEKLVENAATMGARFQKGLHDIGSDHVTNIRGRGLMCAFDLPTTELRNAALGTIRENGMMALPCGPISIRFRPPLNVTEAEVDEANDVLARSIRAL
ncbi:MAG: L-lysine 6-transaminase [Candidatus Eisenbacteria bacterium]|nr:L-lysine 6-transaminase [Candidatus Eisenbacteria bacterium]